jgi:asparagine synthase (glutamine-hydrolysing)
LTAEKYETDHTEILISMNLKDDIETILCNYGEPFMDSSAVPSYYVSREAKKQVTVVLNGDGADELFGGYRRYVPVANNWIRLAKYFSQFANVLPKPNNKQSNLNYIYRLLKLSKKKGLDFYNSATNDIFEDVYSFDSNDTFERMEGFIMGLDREYISALSKMLVMDFNCILPSDLLKKMDIATMAHSLEGRSPFLSKHMLELAPTLNDKFKVKGLNTKVILRKLGKKYLPETLINQPKRGFEVPLKQWVNGELRNNILDSLNGDCYSKTFFPKGFIDRLIEKKIDTSDEKRAKMLWSLYCLELWKKNLA